MKPRELIDALHLNERRVHIEDDEPLGSARKPFTLERDIEVGLTRRLNEGGAEAAGLFLALRKARKDLEARKRASAESPDLFDVCAMLGEELAEEMHGPRTQVLSNRRHGIAGPLSADTTDARLDGIDAERHPKLSCTPLEIAEQRGARIGGLDKEAEGQPSAQDDLLDIDERGPMLAQDLHHRGRDADIVRTVDGDDSTRLRALFSHAALHSSLRRFFRRTAWKFASELEESGVERAIFAHGLTSRRSRETDCKQKHGRGVT